MIIQATKTKTTAAMAKQIKYLIGNDTDTSINQSITNFSSIYGRELNKSQESFLLLHL